MIPRRTPLLAALCLAATPASAQLPILPDDARLAAELQEPLAEIGLPSGPWTDGGLEILQAEGALIQQAWQIPVTDLTSLQILAPLRTQLADLGFETRFECETRACGGFEFRYAMDLLPEPAMHIDLGDFRYLLASRSAEPGPEYIAILVSRASGRGFVHVTWIGTDGSEIPQADRPEAASRTREGALRPKPRTPTEPAVFPAPGEAVTGGLGAGLATDGHAVLTDLSFETGSSRLADTEFASLTQLASWMAAHPEARIVLVGHTDTKGALAGNIELSRKRAEAVRARLAERHGVPADTMKAEGVGYLAPLASNATEAGRMLNRRVEVVLDLTE